MNRARSRFIVQSNDGGFAFKAHGGSITNRGEATAIIDGNIELAQYESFSIPVIDANTEYEQDMDIQFTGSGSKKVVVQQITIQPDSKDCN